MKLNRIEKCMIVLVLLIFISAIVYVSINLYTKKYEEGIKVIIPLTQEEILLSPQIKANAKKYHAYEDLYNSTALIFTYGYNTFGNIDQDSSGFHETMENKFKQANLNYKYLAVKNWRNESASIIAKYEQDITPNDDVCAPEYKLDKNLQEVLNISESCMKNACIINKHKIIIISRDVDFIIQVLKEHNPPKAN